jgi:hypothetical protein
MKHKYSLSKSNHYLFLILGLFSFLTKMYSQLPLPPVLATSNVPEASQYGVMYKLDIPNNGNFSSALTYAIDNSALAGLSYNRVAYFMQLDSKWVWVSMNKFNTTNAQLGIPYANSGIVFQQQVTGMNVYSSVGAGVTNTVNTNGNIEIWPDCYSQGLGLAGIGGNGGTFDFNDTQSPGSNCYGSFQVHNYGASETIFAYNSFLNGNNDDLGIGNNTGNGNPDWTFMYNAANYTTKTIYILVDQGINITTQPSAITVNACKSATIAPLTVSVSVNTGTVTGYTWYSNTANSNTGGTLVATNPSSLTSNSYTPSTSSVGALYYYCTITSSAGSTVTSYPSGAINTNTIPVISVNSGSICSSNSFTMIPSGANTYTYSSGSAIVTPGASTSYTVTGTSSAGCVSASGAVSSVTVNTTPTISVNSGSICSGNSFTMIPSGANTYTYSSGSSVVTPSASTSYTVTGTSAQGCVSIAGAVSSVTVNTTPTISVNSGSICSGNSFTMIPSGANSYTYSGGSAIVTPGASTSYTVTGTSAQGCVSIAGAVSSVTVNTTPTISVNSGSICSGNSFTMIPSGANSYTYSGGSAIVTPGASTSYTVTGTSAQGCVSIAGAVSSVTVNTTPTVAISNGTICSGNSFVLTPTGAATYTYSSGSATVSPISSTVYTITGTSAQGCASASKTVAVTVNTTPTISVNSGSICSGNSFTMIPSGANTYTYSSGSSVVTPGASTSYTVTGTSAQGCVSATGAISSVTVNTTPTISVNSGSICSGNSFTIIPSGANTYTYSSGSSVVTPGASTSYTVTGTSSAGCVSASGAVSSVTVNTTPTVAVTNGTICSGNSFVIAPTGASTYTYSSGSATVSPISSTVYTITGTSAQGCTSASKTVTVTVNTTPTISVNSGSICSSNSFTMIPSGANTYTYSSGSAIVTPTSTSTYTVSGTSLEGCAGLDVTSTVTVNLVPVLSVNSGSICNGQSFTLTPMGANTYTYSSGSAIVTPGASTSYTVTGTSALGCVSVVGAVSSVTVNTTPTIAVNSGSICSGSSFTMIPSGASTYTYSSGSSIVTPTTTSTYTVSGTSLEGCIGLDVTSTVTVNLVPVLSVNSGSICNGQSFTLTPMGANTYTYSSGSSIVTPTTTSTYTVSGTSLEGCAGLDVTATVTVNIVPVLSVNSGSICNGESFTLTPMGANTYTYSSGSSIVTPTTTSSYTVSGTSLEGCIGLDVTSTVTVNLVPLLSVNSGSICEGQSFTLMPMGANTYTYSSGSAVVTPTTTSTYTVSGTSLAGCIGLDATSTITVNVLPTISVISASICAGATGTVIANGANTYTWSTGANTSAITDAPIATTVYSVNGTSLEGCLGSAVTATMTVGSSPSIVVNSASVCAGNSATLTANGVTTYTWNTGANTSSIVVTPTINTVYSVSGNLIGCSVSASNTSTVTINALPSISVNSGVICKGQSFTITASGANTYTYSSGSPVVTPTITSSYTISGTSTAGCVSSSNAIATVTVNPLPVVTLSISIATNTTCLNGPSVSLSGSPVGGVYSGTNVSGNTFSPITNGTFTPVYNYTNTITGCHSAASKTIIVQSCTGIEENVTNPSLVKLFPNPNNGAFTLETGSTENKTVIVTDVTGRIVYSGLYYVSIKTANSLISIKAVKN